METERDIDARSVVTLITFIVVNILVIFPVPLLVPFEQRIRARYAAGKVKTSARHPGDDVDSPWKVRLGLEIAPVVGVLLLLASTCIPGSVVRNGIVGSEGVKPYDIMTLFVCFAYISLSLDSTGLLRYLAALVATRATSSGSRLYTAFYIFFAVIGLLIGNDPLILSGTPFLVYFTTDASIDNPTAYLFTHFQVSNLVSALLVSSNPTNLVLTSAFHISFLRYSAWLALPTVASVIVLYPILRYWQFNTPELMPKQLDVPSVDPKSLLKDRWGGIFGASLFLVTIVLLVGLSAGGILEEGWKGVWIVVLPAALAMFAWDCGRDIVVSKRRRNTRAAGPRLSSATADGAASTEKVVNGDAPRNLRQPSGNAETSGPAEGSGPGEKVVSAPLPSSDPTTISSRNTGILSKFRHTFPTPISTLRRMPWNLVPFAFSMFILVEGLQHTGWIRVFGKWWTAWADVGGVAGCVWLMGMLSVIGCNVFGTNIGATILLSRVLQYWRNTHPLVSNRTLYGSVFALAVGSNFGAYSFVFSASLAGLLWRTILRQKDRHVKQLDFLRYNWLPVIVTMIVGCLIVAGEVCIMY